MASSSNRHAKVEWTSVDSAEADLSPLSAHQTRDEDSEDDEHTPSMHATGSEPRSNSTEHRPLHAACRCVIVLLLLVTVLLAVCVLAIAVVRLATRLPSSPPAALLVVPSVAPSVSCTDICHWPWQPTTSPASATHTNSVADNREQVYALYQSYKLDEFVCPSNFRNLADYSLTFPLSAHRQYAFDEAPHLAVPPLDHTLPHCLAPAAIVYSQSQNCGNGQRPANPADPPCDATQSCTLLFHTNTSTLRSPVILLTGQSDIPVSFFCGLALDYSNRTSHRHLLHWYGQNNDLPDHPQLTGLPIGINCFEMARALRHVLTERWMVGRVGQCWGERRREVVRGWVTNVTLTAVEEHMRRLDEVKRASSDAHRTGVLHALLGLDSYVPSAVFESALTDITRRHWSSDITADNVSNIATLMTQRNTDTAAIQLSSTDTSAPELPCSVLAPTLVTTTPMPIESVAASVSSLSPAAFLTPSNVLNAQQALLDGTGKLAVANFGLTHPRRQTIWEALCSGQNRAANSDWLHCRPNSRELGNGLAAVYDELSPYLYWLSPQGNGYDSHRTWEALYMGAVPVMERLPITRHLFDDSDLPVLLVDDMTQLTKQLLVAHAARFLNMSRDYARRKLQLDHWKELIVSRQREYRAALRANSSEYVWDAMEGRRCWGARLP